MRLYRSLLHKLTKTSSASLMNEEKIYSEIDQLDNKHDTIGNYFLLKKNSKNYNYFLNE